MAELKILIVEDEMIIAANISLQLSELGYEITGILPRGEEALAHINEEMPDIVLLDIQLKGEMDGIQTAQLMQLEHNIPIIYLTANAFWILVIRSSFSNRFAYLSWFLMAIIIFYPFFKHINFCPRIYR